MINEPSQSSSPALALLQFQGADVRKFLQGQLSNDMGLLASGQLTLAGYHNPQGRVLALLRLCAPEPEQVLALLPADLAQTTMLALRRYVLRAKVTIDHVSSAEEIAALARQSAELAPVLRPEAHAEAVASGLPQVYAATSGMFVAQMLNLDCVAAISFTKGCYTGQEIIARSHYRGRIKRRMQRFLTAEALALAPGQSLTLSDGRAAQVVDAIQREDGRCEFLAVAPLPVTIAPAAAALGAAVNALECSPLPLPYALPE
jgi:folate-binding protein YgfZ